MDRAFRYYLRARKYDAQTRIVQLNSSLRSVAQLCECLKSLRSTAMQTANDRRESARVSKRSDLPNSMRQEPISSLLRSQTTNRSCLQFHLQTLPGPCTNVAHDWRG